MIKVKRNDVFYYIGLFILVIISWDYFSKIINFSKLILYSLYIISALCFLVNLTMSKYTKKETMILFVISIVMFFSMLKMREFNIILSFLAIISSKKINIKSIIKCLFISNLFFIIVHILLTITGIFPEKLTYYTYLDQKVRHTFNLRHPNYLAAVIFWTLCQFIYLRKQSKKIQNLLIVFLILLFTYFTTYSRTTIILFIILELIILINNTKWEKIIYKISKPLIFISVITSIYISWKYNLYISNNNSFIFHLNEILSQRLYLNNYALNQFELTFFGQQIFLESSNPLIIDSFYISCFIQYGIWYAIILIYSFLKIPIRKKTMFLYALFSLVIITGITERYIIFITIAFPLFFIRSLFDNEVE